MAVIDWYDNSFRKSGRYMSSVVDTLCSNGHAVEIYSGLTEGKGKREITRLEKTERVDLIITDIHLWEKDAGLTLLERISREGSVNEHTPKLVYTEICCPSTIEEVSKHCGRANYLQKPMRPEDLIQRIEKELPKSQ